MGVIRLLPEQVVNKIAAGEVVERPASVVKELVENALDAGGERILVEIEEGGRTLVRVVDDGCGMDVEDVRLAFSPHATSKLHDVDDLFAIATLGFRGEALPSIGSVADVTIRTRPRGAPGGYAIRNRGGRLEEVRPDGTPEGTKVEVRNLFFNTPARLKFLRTTRTELGHVSDAMTRFALAFPEVGFVLRHGGREVLRTEPDEDRRTRIGQLVGRELADALLPVRSAMDGTRLDGYVAPPSFARPTAAGQMVFLNGRFVRDRSLAHAIREAYRDLIPYGRQPVVFLFLVMDPALVDVNVHPSKTEVRFRRGRELHDLVYRELRETLTRGDIAPRIEAAPGRVEPAAPDRRDRVGEAMAGFLRGRHPGRESAGFAPPAPDPASRGREAGEPRALQLHDTFVVVETGDGIAIVDQHALHERILFDRLKSRLAEGPLPSQGLLSPVVVELDAADAALVAERGEALRRVGFAVEPFGRGAVAVQGVPQATRQLDPGRLLLEVVEWLRDDEAGTSLDRVTDGLCDMIACKAAVKAGDPLPPEQVRALLEEGAALAHGHTCPHGRPTTLMLTREELERYFQRR